MPTNSSPPPKIAFIGLGCMGGYMACNLAGAGFQVTGWNRTPDKPGCKIAIAGGVTIVESIQAAVSEVEVVFTCVGDVPDVRQVLLGPGGVVQHAKPGALLVDTSTIGRAAAKSIGEEVAAKGFRFVDAPLSGGDIGAKAASLTIMVGGGKEDVEELMPCFHAMGSKIVHCGGVGDGQAVKLCNQVLCGVHMVGLCEALALAEKQGLDPNLITEACSSGAAGSWALSNLGPRIINKDYSPGFMIKHMQKDLRLVKAAAAEADQELLATDLAQKYFSVVEKNDDGSELGTQAMMKAFLERGKE